jgi:hypothetical protein
MRPPYRSLAGKSHRRLANSPLAALKKGVLMVKSSGCVRVTAPACAKSGSPKRDNGSQANAAFDPLQCHEVRGEDIQNDQVFGEHGTFSDAKQCQGQWGRGRPELCAPRVASGKAADKALRRIVSV